jgi:hypothetical protein
MMQASSTSIAPEPPELGMSMPPLVALPLVLLPPEPVRSTPSLPLDDDLPDPPPAPLV